MRGIARSRRWWALSARDGAASSVTATCPTGDRQIVGSVATGSVSLVARVVSPGPNPSGGDRWYSVGGDQRWASLWSQPAIGIA
jgi:hypothetical protein